MFPTSSITDFSSTEYRNLEVLCPTFSAGDCGGITELVFPRVMDKILELFWQKKEKAENMLVLRELRKTSQQATAQHAPAA